MNLQPLGNRILVEPDPSKEKTAGGIHIPEVAKEKSLEAVVVAMGKGEDEEGRGILRELKIGTRVLVGKYGGTDITIGGCDYKLVHTRDVLSIVEKKPTKATELLS